MSLSRLQERIAAWVVRTFGLKVLLDREERGLRHVEEAIELAQALGVSKKRIYRLVNVVYKKPVGEISQEIAGSFVTLLSVGEATSIDVYEAAIKEIERVESLPPEHFQKRNAAKAAAGVGNYQVNEGVTNVGV